MAPLLLVFAAALASLASPTFAQQKAKLPRTRRLDSGIRWKRDAATGELRAGPVNGAKSGDAGEPANAQQAIRVATQIVPVTCSVFAADGTAVIGLDRTDFRIFDDGIEQSISYFDFSTVPANVALLIDASPSVLRDSEAMKQAARALVDGLSPADEIAVVDFSAHTYLQIPFSSDGEPVRKAIARVDVHQLLGDTGGTNVYEAVYLTARKVFLGGRQGRKSIVLLTDGQDSGLGLTLDPASAAPQPGRSNDRLTFEDVVRALAAADIQVFAISTENRPRQMTPAWLSAHQDATLINSSARDAGIPPYTLYLAELVRRAGGQLYFLRESGSLSDVFRRIAQRIGAQYTLGYYPRSADSAAVRAGWHQLHVAVPSHASATIIHRAAYYVPATE